MQPCFENAGVKAKAISPTDGHYFFGYYDLQPFDSTGRYHLCHKAPFEDRIPGPEDICELGVLDLQTGEFIKYAETNAWNFQQGAMLQWCGDDDHIIFNLRRDGAFRACVLNVKTGQERILPMAVASLSADGKTAVCVNFSRIFDFRPGYGYAGIPDPYFHINAPEEDGVWVMDVATGACKMVLTTKQIAKAFPELPYTEEKLLVNHITLNPAGNKFVMLFRNQPADGSKWATAAIVSDFEGNMVQLAEWGCHSHYHWKNNDELVIVSRYTIDNDRRLALWLFDVNTGKGVELPEPNPQKPMKDIHCLYSPNQAFIMGDGYPNREYSYRVLHFIEVATNKDTILGEYYSYRWQGEANEYRCDLHARYDRTGRYVSFDSNHEGNRRVYLLDLNDLTDCSYKA